MFTFRPAKVFSFRASPTDAISDQLRPNFEAVSDMLDEAKEDLCAFATFPREHWTKTKVK